MLHGQPVRIEVAAGLDDTTFGTDADPDHGRRSRPPTRRQGVVVLMDLGSAVLSAELALELLDDDVPGAGRALPGPAGRGADRRGGGRGRRCGPRRGRGGGGGRARGQDVPSGGADAGGGRPDPAVGAADALTGAFTVANPHGLHARPAARVVQAVRMLDARVAHPQPHDGIRVGARRAACRRWPRSAPCPATRSRSGSGGNQAREALDHLLELAARNFDEPLDGPAAPVRGDTARLPRGRGVDRAAPIPAVARRGHRPGVVAAARADRPHRDRRRATRPSSGAGSTESIAAVRRSVSRVRARATRDVGEAEAAIFDAHLLLLDDADLLDDVHARVDGGAARRAPPGPRPSTRSRRDLADMPDPYLRARAADVAAVRDAVLRELLGVTHGGRRAERRAGGGAT